MGGVVVDMVPSNSSGILDLANHGSRGDRSRKGLFCLKEGLDGGAGKSKSILSFLWTLNMLSKSASCSTQFHKEDSWFDRKQAPQASYN